MDATTRSETPAGAAGPPVSHAEHAALLRAFEYAIRHPMEDDSPFMRHPASGLSPQPPHLPAARELPPMLLAAD